MFQVEPVAFQRQPSSNPARSGALHRPARLLHSDRSPVSLSLHQILLKVPACPFKSYEGSGGALCTFTPLSHRRPGGNEGSRSKQHRGSVFLVETDPPPSSPQLVSRPEML